MLAHAVLMLLVRSRTSLHREHSPGGNRLKVFTRFRSWVEIHFRSHGDMPRYAQALHIEEKRMNRLCVKLVQQNAFAMVQNRLMLEARRKLAYVAASVAQIAYELGFNDPGYFCRAFMRHCGRTPSEFRRRGVVVAVRKTHH